LLGPGLFFSSIFFFRHPVGLLGRVISPSQGRYLNTGQHKHRINAHTDILALSRIRIHDPRFRARQDSSCHCGQLTCTINMIIIDEGNAIPVTGRGLWDVEAPIFSRKSAHRWQ
jgi:hypothetical protein